MVDQWLSKVRQFTQLGSGKSPKGNDILVREVDFRALCLLGLFGKCDPILSHSVERVSKERRDVSKGIDI